MVIWGLRPRGWGLGLGFWGWGFQLMGFGASGVGPSGVFGVGALYINVEQPWEKNFAALTTAQLMTS